MAEVPAIRLRTLPIQSVENHLGGTVVWKPDVLRAMSDLDIYEEADRRGMIFSEDDFLERPALVEVSDYALRQNISLALRDLERILSGWDRRFAGFAEDVERHYGRAA